MISAGYPLAEMIYVTYRTEFIFTSLFPNHTFAGLGYQP